MSEIKYLEFEVYGRKAGSSFSKKLRRKQLVPAIVYGPGQKNKCLSLDIRVAKKYAQKEYDNKIFTFRSEEKELNGLKVLKKHISYHKISRRPLHIDFLSLDMSKKVRVNVEVYFTGKAKGVRESGGVFNVIRRTVEIECLPAQIPDSFSIDISPLGINQNFHVSDLQIPDTLKLITSSKSVLCMVSEITEETKDTEASDTPDSATASESGVDLETDKKTEDKSDKK